MELVMIKNVTTGVYETTIPVNMDYALGMIDKLEKLYRDNYEIEIVGEW